MKKIRKGKVSNMINNSRFEQCFKSKKELEILYEDKDIIVCVKPPRVPSQSDKSMDYDMVSRVRNHLVKKGEDAYVAIINRLDRPVRGIVLFAKNKKAAAALSKMMQAHDFGKYYKATVRIDEDNYVQISADFGKEITLTDYLLKDAKTNTSKVVASDVKGAKKAVLKYVMTESGKRDIANVEIELLTGRHHQIRVQMAHAGFPLVGDTKYGKETSMAHDDSRNSASSNNSVNNLSPSNKFVDVELCAFKMIIQHPTTGEKMIFEI